MRKIVLIILGVIVVGVLGFVALGVWNANQTIDASNPQYAGMFKENFMKICVAEGNKTAAAKNKPFTDEETARMEQICSCGAEDGLEHFKSRPNVKIMDLLTDKALQQEINGVMEACAKKLSPQ